MSLKTKWVGPTPFTLTHWFSGNKFNPGSPGIYQRRLPNGNLCYSYWNGEYWCLYGYTIENAYQGCLMYKSPSYYQNLPFRGLKNVPT